MLLIYLFSGVPIAEVIALRPKMYSILLNDKSEKRTAKGISKTVIKKQFHHELYRNCLISKTKTVNDMKSIRSENHDLFLDNINKVGLCAYDDKRYVKDCGIDSYAYGHHAIRDELTLNVLRILEFE